MSRKSQDTLKHRQSQAQDSLKHRQSQAQDSLKHRQSQIQDPLKHRQSQVQDPSKRRRRQSQHHHGHRKSHYSLTEDYDYDFTLDTYPLNEEVKERLIKARAGQKIAFLSTSERQYYPEFPGHSRFALAFQDALPDPTLPSPQFHIPPFENRLKKPISKKGYGIGGLSGPRFPVVHAKTTPSPNQYQKHIKEVLTRQHRFPPQVWINYGLLGPEDKIWDAKVSRKLFSLWGKCHQIKVAFGTSISQGRFGKKPSWNLVGPGNYAFSKLQLQPPTVFNSFLSGPTKFNSPTKLHCSYGPKDNCLECDTQLMTDRDYYRSRYKLKPIPLRPIIEDTEEHILQALSESKQAGDTAKGKAKRVLLCRSCYCKALRGESRYWKTKAEVQRLFEKSRHCGYIHEHNSLPEYTLKASCYWTRKLAQKEAVLSKHYLDKCEKRMVERKQTHRA